MFEYPAGAIDPTFELDKGVLWIGGYKAAPIPVLPAVNCLKRFDINLLGYVVVGKYSEAKNKIQGDFSKVITDNNVDTDNLVVFIKKLNNITTVKECDACEDD